jgi:saccharopine dehydrogenase (NADP+, L-glutamate forming)
MAERGQVCLVEAGLDPGIDHLLSHKLVAEAAAALGPEAVDVSFHSYCGGLPVRPTPFRYKFSWAPAGVLLALDAPARWIEGGRRVDCPHPWEAVVGCSIGSERFESYPNRDSTPFVEQYGFPEQWRVADFVRGTLRLEGWRSAWARVFETVKTHDRAAIEALAESLADQHSYAPGEPDRIVMGVSLEARRDGRVRWRNGYALDFQGNAEESAMARAVSHTVAIAAIDVLNGRIPAGIGRAIQAVGDCDRWLAALGEVGIAPTRTELSIKAA